MTKVENIKVDNESKQGGDQSNKEVLGIDSVEGENKPIEVVKDSTHVGDEIPKLGAKSTHVGE